MKKDELFITLDDLFTRFKPITVDEMKRWAKIHGLDYHDDPQRWSIEIAPNSNDMDGEEEKQIKTMKIIMELAGVKGNISVTDHFLLYKTKEDENLIVYQTGAIVVEIDEETREYEFD